MVNAIKQKSLTSTSKTFCEPDRIRTYDRLLRREVLYPAELRARNFNMSGWQDSNLRPPRPKRGAITGLRYTPKMVIIKIAERQGFEPWVPSLVRRFSKPLLSATQAPLLSIVKNYTLIFQMRMQM